MNGMPKMTRPILEILHSMDSAMSYVLVSLTAAFLLIWMGWLTLFVLDLVLDTSRGTAEERWRAIRRHIVFGVVIQAVLVALFVVLYIRKGG